MEPALFSLALLAYLAVAVVRLPGLIGPSPLGARVGVVALWAAPLTHIAGLGVLGARVGTLPLWSAGPGLLSLSALLGLANVAMRRQARAEALSGVVAALSATLLGVGLLLPSEVPLAPSALSNLWFPVHAAMIFLGLAGFALAFGASCVYLAADRRLRARRFDGLEGWPSIDTLDHLNTRFILTGFVALTLGIASGGLWATSRPEGGADLGPTVLISFVLWGWYAAAVLVRVVGGWRGRMAAHFSLVGFVGMVVGLGAIALSRSGWHG